MCGLKGAAEGHLLQRHSNRDVGAFVLRFIAATASFVLVSTGDVVADEAARRGEAIVEQWCRMCHQRETDPADPDMAPPFEQIAKRKGRDEAYLARFMREDHFPMTTFRLFDHEKADVVAYLRSLQRRPGKRP